MKTRNSPKSEPPKKTPAKKTPLPKPSPEATTPTIPTEAKKTTPSSTASTDVSTPKSGSATTPKQQKSGVAAAAPKAASKPKIEEATSSAMVSEKKVMSEKEATPPASEIASVATTNKAKPPARKVTRVVKTIVKKKVLKPKAAKAATVAADASVDKLASKEEPVGSGEGTPKQEEADVANVNDSVTNRVQVGEALKNEDSVAANVGELPSEKEEVVEDVQNMEAVSNPTSVESPKEVESEPVNDMDEEQEEKGDDGEKSADPSNDPENSVNNMPEDVEENKEKNIQLEEEKHNVDETMEDVAEQERFQEPADEECKEEIASEPEEEDNESELEEDDESSVPEKEDNEPEPEENAKGSEEENREISALANERRSKKEREIFVGGLDRDTVEEDILKVFQKIGEVTEVRLHRNQSTNKNKGYAFVKFANKELASKALSDLKHPVIRGKQCGIAPSEDNDTLFVGNICNTWTKEAIKKKLKEYGLEGVETITLVADPQHAGLSRGFAFVEFSSHADAMLAYKRLQKADVVFGHAERTVKVAFAEPLREPDPEIMAQVKEVFVDGLPPHWDEEHVREHFKAYGEVERIVLARNLTSPKRKDFAFVNFNTHEAATACINALNNTELGDEKAKSRVKVRLSNPQPKTQAVKGELCGGFRIGRVDSGFSRFGKGLGQEKRPPNRINSQRSRDSYTSGRGRTGKSSRVGQDISEDRYSRLHRRRSPGGYGYEGRRGYDEEYSSRHATSSRPDLSTSRYSERGHDRSNAPRRQQYSPERQYSRTMEGRHYVEDPYRYEDGGYALKRPYSMLDHEPGYLEPNRLRPRFDHPDPIVSSRESRYHDPLGAERDIYPADHYSSGYGGDAYPSMYRGERPYGSRYYNNSSFDDIRGHRY